MSDYSPYSSVSDLLGRLGWRTLQQRRADSRLVLFYKIVHGLVVIPLPTYVIPFNHYSRTTHSLAFRQLYARTDYNKYSFFPLAVVQWNNLSASTATLTNLDSLTGCQSGVPPETINLNTTVFILTFTCFYCILFYKIVHGLVAIPLPTYVIPFNRYLTASNWLSVRNTTRDHKSKHHCFYPHFFLFLLTLYTFILFSLSALFLILYFYRMLRGTRHIILN